MSQERLLRVAEQIQHELAQLIQQKLKNPEAQGLWISIISVEVNKDLSKAKVFFTELNNKFEITQKILDKAAGFLRSEIAHKINLRFTPELVFIYDDSMQKGARITELLRTSGGSKIVA